MPKKLTDGQVTLIASKAGRLTANVLSAYAGKAPPSELSAIRKEARALKLPLPPARPAREIPRSVKEAAVLGMRSLRGKI